jgi:hypothetical protein
LPPQTARSPTCLLVLTTLLLLYRFSPAIAPQSRSKPRYPIPHRTTPSESDSRWPTNVSSSSSKTAALPSWLPCPALKILSSNIRQRRDADSWQDDFLFKVVLIGDSGVGKSNLLSRFTRFARPSQRLRSSSRATILSPSSNGADPIQKRIQPRLKEHEYVPRQSRCIVYHGPRSHSFPHKSEKMDTNGVASSAGSPPLSCALPRPSVC